MYSSEKLRPGEHETDGWGDGSQIRTLSDRSQRRHRWGHPRWGSPGGHTGKAYEPVSASLLTGVEGWTTNPSLPFSSCSEKHRMHGRGDSGPFVGTCRRNTGRVKMAYRAHWKFSAFFLGFARLSLLP